MRNTVSAGEAHDLVVTVKGDRLRFDLPGAGGPATHAIYDPARNKVTVLFDSAKQFMELDFASPAAPGPNTDPKTSSIVARGTHKKVAGFDCEEWTAEDGAGHKADVCLAEGVTFLDLNRLRSGGAESALGKRFRQNKSFPLESVEYDASGKELSRMKVIQIDRAAEPDSAFVIPAGYVKTEMPQRPPQR